MTYPDDILAGLNASPAERLAYLRVLDEVDAEEAAGLPEPDYEDPGEGPWHDLHAAGAAMDGTYAADAQVAAEDAEDAEAAVRRPSAEDKLARGMRRAEAGTLMPSPYFRGDPALARDAHGRYAPGACGDTVEGYCSARFHDPSCSSTVAGTAAVESAASAEAWKATLANHPPDPGTLGYTAEFAGPAEPLGGSDTWADLLHSGVPDHEVHQRMLAELGEAEPPPREPREPMPDVSGFRSAMGI